MQNGGGTRIKLLDAAAYGLPIVSTRMGAEGLAFADAEHILLRERDADIAAACVSLLQDPALGGPARPGRAALTRQHYERAPSATSRPPVRRPGPASSTP